MGLDTKNVTCWYKLIVSLQLRPLLLSALSMPVQFPSWLTRQVTDSSEAWNGSTWELSDSKSIFESCRDATGAWPRSELLSKGVTELTELHVSPEAGHTLLLV